MATHMKDEDEMKQMKSTYESIQYNIATREHKNSWASHTTAYKNIQ